MSTVRSAGPRFSLAPGGLVPLGRGKTPPPSFEPNLPRSRVSEDSASNLGPVTTSVSAVLLGATGLGVVTMVPAVAHPDSIAATTPESTPVHAAAVHLDATKHTLDEGALADARRELWSAYVGSTTATPVEKTRGQEVFEALAKNLEARMRLTAWDYAHPETWEPLEGAPGYKKLPESVVRNMIVDALREVPIGELPGGSSLAGIVRGLPNAGHIDAEKMSFNELTDALGDAQKAWFEARFGPFLSEHKVESVVVAAGTITAIRYASPEAAGVIDRVAPRIRVWRDGAEDGSWDARADLKYRDRRVLPDLDLRGGVYGDVGDVRLRATATGTVAVERDRPVTGEVTLGARIGDDTSWADLAGTVDHRGGRRIGLTGGTNMDGIRLSGGAHGSFGAGSAVGSADGRVRFELSATKDLKLKNATGDFGLYTSYGVDTDGKHDDFRIGVGFTLRW